MILFVNNNKGILFLRYDVIPTDEIWNELVYLNSKVTTKIYFYATTVVILASEITTIVSDISLLRYEENYNSIITKEYNEKSLILNNYNAVSNLELEIKLTSKLN